jgi:hypothetical protein
MTKADLERRELIVAALTAALVGGEALAQDAVKVMPKRYRVAMENEKIRVLEYTSRPGDGVCGEGWHSHPAHLTVLLSDSGPVKVTEAGGKEFIATKPNKLGDVFWSEATTHKVENAGKINTRILIIELKDAPPQKS